MRTDALLVILCGLPGSGKTTLARQLEASLPAIRMSADDWMEGLAINLHAEDQRARIEALQWQLTRRLLTLGQGVVIEWGAWGKGRGTSSGRKLVNSERALSFIICLQRRKSFLEEFESAMRKIHRLRGKRYRAGSRSLSHQRLRR